MCVAVVNHQLKAISSNLLLFISVQQAAGVIAPAGIYRLLSRQFKKVQLSKMNVVK